MCIGLDSYSRGRSDGYITIAEQRASFSFFGPEGLPLASSRLFGYCVHMGGIY